jgi:hypothetical protein
VSIKIRIISKRVADPKRIQGAKGPGEMLKNKNFHFVYDQLGLFMKKINGALY